MSKWSDRILEKNNINTSLIETRSEHEIMTDEWSHKFVRLMKARILTGFFRYGSIKERKKRYKSIVPHIKKMILKYEETGNTEFLVDGANWCMVEFMCGYHKNKHFKAQDREF